MNCAQYEAPYNLLPLLVAKKGRQHVSSSFRHRGSVSEEEDQDQGSNLELWFPQVEYAMDSSTLSDRNGGLHHREPDFHEPITIRKLLGR